jgi:hypothetical protein
LAFPLFINSGFARFRLQRAEAYFSAHGEKQIRRSNVTGFHAGPNSFVETRGRVALEKEPGYEYEIETHACRIALACCGVVRASRGRSDDFGQAILAE